VSGPDAHDDLDQEVEALEGTDHENDLTDDVDPTERGSALLRNRRRVFGLAAAIVLSVVAIYVVFPKVVGVGDAFDRLNDVEWYWIAIALGMQAVTYAAYATLLRSVMGKRGPEEVRRRLDLSATTQITFAGLAATALFSAAGAGGIALTYWALRKAGMERRRAACRIVAFNVIQYAIYFGSLVLFGVLLRTGVLPGESPVSVTIVPAALAALAIVIVLLIARIPGDAERRLTDLGRHPRLTKLARRLATVPAVLATGVRTAIAHVRNPRLGPESYGAAILYWAGTIGTLWAGFEAVGVHPPLAVMIQGFFVGMVANVIPSPAAGVGTVDAGLIGAFVVFGLPSAGVFAGVLIFRVIGYLLPIPIGVVAYVKLLATAHGWEAERRSGATIQSEVKAKAR
jgi:uncharacterized protein (TIRG00374 family)